MTLLTFEEHASVLATWWDLPKRPRTLVYFDAHLDLQQISPSRLRRLADCKTAQQLASLNKPHHLNPDEAFSYSIEDFLYPAHRLGLIDRIVWVAPPHVLTADPLATFGRMQQMDGVSFDELMTFQRRPDGSIAGRLLGVDLVICDYRQLAEMKLPPDSLVDIDIDYFVALPDESLWVRPRTVFEVITKLIPKPDLVTISRSVSSGFTPLRYRFLADNLESLYCGRTADSDHFEYLLDIDEKLLADAREIAADMCRLELKDHPDCAATRYLLSLASTNPQEVQDNQQRTALNPAYRDHVLREACEFPCRGRLLDLTVVKALERRLVDGQLNATEEALAWAAIGLLHCHLGRVESARHSYRQTTRHFPHHPELANAIAVALVRARRTDEAMPYLEVAATSDKTSAGAHMLLASLSMQNRDAKRALNHLQIASARAPAWIHLLEMQCSAHTSIGEFQKATELSRKCAEMRQQAVRLVERIRPN